MHDRHSARLILTVANLNRFPELPDSNLGLGFVVITGFTQLEHPVNAIKPISRFSVAK